MSSALWCDKGEHAFSAKDPEKRHFSQTRQVEVNTGNSYGTPTYQSRQEVTEELDICGPCYNASNPFSSAQATPKALQPTLEDLEEEDENYRRGYEAAQEELALRKRPMSA